MLTKGRQCHRIKVGNELIVFDHYDFSPEKDELLTRVRGIGFEEVICLLEGQESFLIVKNSSPKYPHQFIFEVDVRGYTHIVPFIVEGTCAYLKTIYPSRKATKKRRKSPQ